MTSDDPIPEVLTIAANEAEAALIANRLQDEGILSTIGGEFAFAFRADIPRKIKVLVPRSDLDRAKMLLEAMKTEQKDIDWSKVDVGQPDGEPA